MWLPFGSEARPPFGAVSQAIIAFQASLNALSVVVRKFRSVSSLLAEGGRLDALAEALAKACSAATSSAPALELTRQQALLEAQGVTLQLPTGEQLCNDVSFALHQGERMMVSGPSGAGKTTLVRAVAGLWNHGSGSLRRASSTVFLSQEPYIPEGSLRRVLTFPASCDAFEDEAILAAARAAQLGHVLERFAAGGPLTAALLVEADWEAVLSRGEQQRCAFCRLLLLRPDLIVLDEATAALDEATEEALYRQLIPSDQELGPGVVSVSHRPALQRFHTHLLQCGPARSEGSVDRMKSEWVFKKVDGDPS